MSFWLLVLTVAYYFYPDLSIIIFLPIVIHLIAFIQSTLSTYQDKESEALSKDCIWFNAFMVLVYLFILYFN